MATEKRMIDANALIAWCRAQADDPWNGRVAPVSWGAAFEEFIDCIGDVTTVDAVEVVRCKDCKHYMLWEDSDDEKTCAKSIGLMVSAPDDFCSYGERRAAE